jgi:superfamily II DNA or RNA helicase
MKVVLHDPDTGYLDRYLWVPKRLIDISGTKHALTYEITEKYGRQRTQLLFLWKESEHHLLVPRTFWDTSRLACRVIDCRPRAYPVVEFKSRIKLDHRLKEINGKKILMPTGESLQERSLSAMQSASGGILQLACVAGDTVLNINRAGGGFARSIARVYEALHGVKAAGRAWDMSIPTYIRSDIGGRAGLHRIQDVVFRGRKQTYEIVLEDNKRLRLTIDHEVLTPAGFVSILTGLRVGATVLTDSGQIKWGTKAASTAKKKPVYRRLHWYPSHPYAHKNGTKCGPLRGLTQTWTLEEHRAVAEATLNGLTLRTFRERCRNGRTEGLQFLDPAKYHVHHRDKNPKNNDPSNLEVMLREEHRALHQPYDEAFDYGRLVPVRIKSIEVGSIEAVYDVVCDDPFRNFVANGIVVHNCGKGKTVITLELIARGRVPALVLVDNTNLLAQWKEEAESLLDIPGGIGIFGAGKKEWKKGLVLATYHSIANWSESIPEEARRWFGIIVSDEAHHVSAPMFSKTADMFYGARYGLTATPERSDGLHVLCDGHIGPVLFKDLTPTMKPSFGFYWTGLSLNLSDPTTASKVLDINGEVHLSKLTAYNGQWPERMRVVLQAVGEAYAVGRMVLVLANSVDEVMNLASCWERPGQPLYTDIPIPTPGEVGEQMHPLELSPQEVEKVNRKIAHYEEQHKRSTNATAREQLQAALTKLRQQLKQHEVARKIDNELKRRQRTYVAQLIRDTKTAGMLSYEVPTATREKFLKERMVIFSIMKYGKEGMNCQRLDTVILSSLFSDANGLKQLIGRPTRPLPGKKTPVLLAIVDNIGPVIGMARKLMNHLRDWPHEEGGPYDPILIGFPESWRTRHKFPTTSLLFGQS